MLSSCDKENSRNGTPDEQEMSASKVSSEADGEAEIIFNGLFDDALGVNAEVGMGGTGIFGRNEVCPEVTLTHTAAPAVFPIRVVLNFGPNGCVGNDGHFRKGKIIIEYSDRLVFPNATATTTFDGFYFDSTKVEGTHIIKNTSASNLPMTNKSWEVKVVNAKLTRPSGNYTMWNSLKNIVQVEGASTQMPMDDQFKITGNASGTVLRGTLLVNWESNIIEPLLKKMNCHWIVKGVVRTIRRNLSTTSPWVGVLNFSPGLTPTSSGECDRIATVTINGVTHIITLP
jgi:hypothetical protein